MTQSSRSQATAARHQQLLDAALHCFVVSGFHQTSMRDIAAQAKVSLGSLYNHFESKSALIAEIAQMESTEFAPLVAQLQKQPGRSGLLRFSRDYAALHQDPARLMLGAEVLSELLRHPELAAPFLATRQHLVLVLAAAIEQARADGELAPGMAAPDLAGLLLDAIEGRCFVDALARSQTPAMRIGGSIQKLVEALLAPATAARAPRRA